MKKEYMITNIIPINKTYSDIKNCSCISAATIRARIQHTKIGDAGCLVGCSQHRYDCNSTSSSIETFYILMNRRTRTQWLLKIGPEARYKRNDGSPVHWKAIMRTLSHQPLIPSSIPLY